MLCLSHKFLYSCFHPVHQDQVLNLEMSTYPSEISIHKMHTSNESSEQDETEEAQKPAKFGEFWNFDIDKTTLAEKQAAAEKQDGAHEKAAAAAKKA